jgi:phage shock protein A
MALLERVTTLIRANLNDLIDRAEDPEKLIKQVILDMQNQLIQLKTQIAISIADEHMLEKKRKENEEKSADWMRKAELAVDKGQDDLARIALERHRSCGQLAQRFVEQIEDQKMQVENLKSAFSKLEQKLAEAQSKSDLLIARHRRSRVASKAFDAQMKMGDRSQLGAFDRLNNKVVRAEAIGQTKLEMISDDVENRFSQLEQEDEINKLLNEIKTRRKVS